MNEAMMSSKRQDWETPRAFFESIDRRFDFSLDVAATAENAKCLSYIGEDEDALVSTWHGRCWMNPPYGRQMGAWVARAAEQVESGAASIVVALVPARVDTAWWQDHCAPQLHRFLRGRIMFEIDGEPMRDAKGRPMRAPFPSALVYFGL